MIYAIWTALNLYLQFAGPHNSDNSPSVNTNYDANQYTSAHPPGRNSSTPSMYPGIRKSAMKMISFEKSKFSPRSVGQFECLQKENTQLNFSDIDGEFERIYLQR
jgi:hypothetical protein